jgi:alkylation response protein AidB-like acyl-CoA dehydrogenase
MRNKAVHFEVAFEIYNNVAADKWRDAMVERGWTAPTWPTEYGGGGLNFE